MPVTLTAISGPGAGKVLELRSGQSAHVGRGEEADCSIPDDPKMSHDHFLIEGRPDCGLLTDLQSTNGTFVNGEPVIDVIVASGDEIFAGQTTFAVTVGVAPRAASQKPARGIKVSFDAKAAVVCDGLLLTEDARLLLDDQQSAGEFVEGLKKNSLYADALRVLSRAMGTPAALLWSSGCVEGILGDRFSSEDAQAIQSARKWAVAPTAQNAANAFAAAEALKNEGPTAMLALAAFWGGGSLAPLGQPVIPVDEQLPSQAISGALTLVAVGGPPEAAAEKYESFIHSALSTAQG